MSLTPLTPTANIPDTFSPFLTGGLRLITAISVGCGGGTGFALIFERSSLRRNEAAKLRRGILLLACSWMIAIMILASSPVANAIPIDLFNTGVNSLGQTLSSGDEDPHYIVLETGNLARVRSSLPPTYAPNDSCPLPNDSCSMWIWQGEFGGPVWTTRSFRTTFDLAGYDPSTAVINGLWGTDDIGVDILINSFSTGISLPGILVSNFSMLHLFTIDNGFHSGLNTLDFIVRDEGVVAGFRAELSGTVFYPIPEPSTILLLGTGLLGVVGIARRRE